MITFRILQFLKHNLIYLKETLLLFNVVNIKKSIITYFQGDFLSMDIQQSFHALSCIIKSE